MFEQLMQRGDPTARPKKHTISKRMVNGMIVNDVPNPWDLSAMEFEVLRQLREYKKQAMIAEFFQLSRKTVNTYLVRAKAKMGCKTLYEAQMMFNDFMCNKV